MQFEFETKGSHTYLVYEVPETEQLDTFVKGMLTNNKIPGLANTVITQMNRTYSVRYEVSSMISASQLFAGTVNKKRMLGFFRGITEAFISAEEYMLDEPLLLLDCEYIFVNVVTGKTVMICLPVHQLIEEKRDVSSFLKQILYHVKFDPDDDTSYVALLMNYFNSNLRFSAETFKDLLDEIECVKLQVQEPAAAPVQPEPVPAPVPPAAPVPPPVSVPHVSVPPYVPPKAPAPAPVPEQTKVKMPGGGSIAIPGKDSHIPHIPTGGTDNKKTETPAPASDEEEITWLYLMQHYNKENAEKYKKQKEAKKAGKNKNKTPAAPPPAAPVLPQNTPVNQPYPVPPQNTPVNQPYSAPPQNAPVNQPYSAPPQSTPTKNYTPIPPAPAVQQPVPPQNTPYQGTTVLNPSALAGGTTVLNPAQKQKPPQKKAFLHRIKNGEKVEVRGDMFRIGREQSYVDYCIADNTAISSSHAYITHKAGKYFITDTNSTNNTYVNTVMLPSSTEKEIVSGDKISFANEEFEFEIA